MIKVSVIIPTRNRVEYLARCLDSLYQQSTLPFEIIVVDNSDKPVKDMVLKSNSSHSKLNYLYSPLKGVSKARNLGIAKAKGSLLAFLDDDCLVNKNWVEEIIKSCKSHPTSVIMGKNVDGIPNNSFSLIENFRTKERFEKELYKSGDAVYAKWLDTKNFALSKRIVLQHKLYFDTRFDNYSRGEDIDLSMRLEKLSIPIIFCRTCIVRHFGATSLIEFLKKEFSKGKGRFHLEKKWPRLKNSDHKRFYQFKDLINDEIYKKRSFTEKLVLLTILILGHIAFKFGKAFESICR